MTLSVIMPAYNEEGTIERAIQRVLAQALVAQLIVVDDGSTDGTRASLASMQPHDPRMKVIVHSHNRGKGAAVRTALGHVNQPICIIQDADLEYHPDDFVTVTSPIANGHCKVVYGSRVLHPENRYPLDWFRVGSFVVTHAANVLYRTQLTDEPTGYKAFDTAFLKSLPLQAQGFDFCPEVTAWVAKRGEDIVEVPIRYAKRSVAEGKKIRWQDGLQALHVLVKLRFN